MNSIDRMTTSKELVSSRVINGWRRQVERETFNGLKLQEINSGIDDETLREAIGILVTQGDIDVISSATQLNPHIKRLPTLSKERQLASLDVSEKYHTCLYPTASFISRAIDLSLLAHKPFSKELAAGNEQLKPIFFELGVLDRYRLDPRYSFHCSEYAGRISMMSESEKTGAIPERDQTFIETFGLGVDNNERAVVCVYLRYLSMMSPEHQRYWETFISDTPALMHENYYKPTIRGDFWENNSAIAAIRLSINRINAICSSVWGKPLFLVEVPPDVHYNLSPFMRASRSDYLSFAHELDKLTSENISASFFDGLVEREVLTRNSDGTIERKRLGTLALLETWLFEREMTWEDPERAKAETIGVLKTIRKERQPAAHTIIKNEFDNEFVVLKRKLLLDAAFALGNILFMLARHPNAPAQRVPKFLEEARIESW